MTIVAGIDEAGLGPVLGPLVVSASAFSIPDEMEGESMWRLLGAGVARKVSKHRPAVVIGDSKKLYAGQRSGDLQHLERGVLAMLATHGVQPGSLAELLSALSPSSLAALRGYPWYARADLPLPHRIEAVDASLAGNALAAHMARAGLRLEILRAECVFEGEFNRVVQATNNKSTAVFDVTCRLLMSLWRTFPGRRLVVHVDRQGGRTRYLTALQRVFQGCSFKVLDETDLVSTYRLTDPDHWAELHFCVKAEDRHLSVALASMTSKYLRELFMVLFNRFWMFHLPQLRPTGGYYTDGMRFLRDIQPAMEKLGVDRQAILRSR